MGKAGIGIFIHVNAFTNLKKRFFKKVSSHFHWVLMVALVVFSTMLAANLESLWLSAVSHPERTQYPSPPLNSPPSQHQQEICLLLGQRKLRGLGHKGREGKERRKTTWLFLKDSPTFKTHFLICSNWRHNFLKYYHRKHWDMQSFLCEFFFISSLLLMWIAAPQHVTSFPMLWQQK